MFGRTSPTKRLSITPINETAIDSHTIANYSLQSLLPNTARKTGIKTGIATPIDEPYTVVKRYFPERHNSALRTDFSESQLNRLLAENDSSANKFDSYNFAMSRNTCENAKASPSDVKKHNQQVYYMVSGHNSSPVKPTYLTAACNESGKKKFEGKPISGISTASIRSPNTSPKNTTILNHPGLGKPSSPYAAPYAASAYNYHSKSPGKDLTFHQSSPRSSEYSPSPTSVRTGARSLYQSRDYLSPVQAANIKSKTPSPTRYSREENTKKISSISRSSRALKFLNEQPSDYLLDQINISNKFKHVPCETCPDSPQQNKRASCQGRRDDPVLTNSSRKPDAGSSPCVRCSLQSGRTKCVDCEAKTLKFELDKPCATKPGQRRLSYNDFNKDNIENINRFSHIKTTRDPSLDRIRKSAQKNTTNYEFSPYSPTKVRGPAVDSLRLGSADKRSGDYITTEKVITSNTDRLNTLLENAHENYGKPVINKTEYTAKNLASGNAHVKKGPASDFSLSLASGLVDKKPPPSPSQLSLSKELDTLELSRGSNGTNQSGTLAQTPQAVKSFKATQATQNAKRISLVRYQAKVELEKEEPPKRSWMTKKNFSGPVVGKADRCASNAKKPSTRSKSIDSIKSAISQPGSRREQDVVPKFEDPPPSTADYCSTCSQSVIIENKPTLADQPAPSDISSHGYLEMSPPKGRLFTRLNCVLDDIENQYPQSPLSGYSCPGSTGKLDRRVSLTDCCLSPSIQTICNRKDTTKSNLPLCNTVCGTEKCTNMESCKKYPTKTPMSERESRYSVASKRSNSRGSMRSNPPLHNVKYMGEQKTHRIPTQPRIPTLTAIERLRIPSTFSDQYRQSQSVNNSRATNRDETGRSVAHETTAYGQDPQRMRSSRQQQSAAQMQRQEEDTRASDISFNRKRTGPNSDYGNISPRSLQYSHNATYSDATLIRHQKPINSSQTQNSRSRYSVQDKNVDLNEQETYDVQKLRAQNYYSSTKCPFCKQNNPSPTESNLTEKPFCNPSSSYSSYLKDSSPCNVDTPHNQQKQNGCESNYRNKKTCKRYTVTFEGCQNYPQDASQTTLASQSSCCTNVEPEATSPLQHNRVGVNRKNYSPKPDFRCIGNDYNDPFVYSQPEDDQQNPMMSPFNCINNDTIRCPDPCNQGSPFIPPINSLDSQLRKLTNNLTINTLSLPQTDELNSPETRNICDMLLQNANFQQQPIPQSNEYEETASLTYPHAQHLNTGNHVYNEQGHNVVQSPDCHQMYNQISQAFGAQLGNDLPHYVDCQQGIMFLPVTSPPGHSPPFAHYNQQTNSPLDDVVETSQQQFENPNQNIEESVSPNMVQQTNPPSYFVETSQQQFENPNQNIEESVSPNMVQQTNKLNELSPQSATYSQPFEQPRPIQSVEFVTPQSMENQPFTSPPSPSIQQLISPETVSASNPHYVLVRFPQSPPPISHMSDNSLQLKSLQSAFNESSGEHKTEEKIHLSDSFNHSKSPNSQTNQQTKPFQMFDNQQTKCPNGTNSQYFNPPQCASYQQPRYFTSTNHQQIKFPQCANNQQLQFPQCANNQLLKSPQRTNNLQLASTHCVKNQQMKSPQLAISQPVKSPQINPCSLLSNQQHRSPKQTNSHEFKSPEGICNQQLKSPQPTSGNKPISPQHTCVQQLKSPQPTSNHRPISPQCTIGQQLKSPQHTCVQQLKSPQHTNCYQLKSPQPTSNHQLISPQCTIGQQLKSPQHTSGHELISPQQTTSNHQLKSPQHTSGHQLKSPQHTSNHQLKSSQPGSYQNLQSTQPTADVQPQQPSKPTNQDQVDDLQDVQNKISRKTSTPYQANSFHLLNGDNDNAHPLGAGNTLPSVHNSDNTIVDNRKATNEHSLHSVSSLPTHDLSPDKAIPQNDQQNNDITSPHASPKKIKHSNSGRKSSDTKKDKKEKGKSVILDHGSSPTRKSLNEIHSPADQNASPRRSSGASSKRKSSSHKSDTKNDKKEKGKGKSVAEHENGSQNHRNSARKSRSKSVTIIEPDDAKARESADVGVVSEAMDDEHTDLSSASMLLTNDDLRSVVIDKTVNDEDLVNLIGNEQAEEDSRKDA